MSLSVGTGSSLTPVLSHVYNAIVVDGKFGLISMNGPSTFSQAYFRTDDTHFPINTSVQHMDAAVPLDGTALGDTSLTSAELAPIVDASIARLTSALSLDASAVARLRQAHIEIGDLFGVDLGITVGNDITISRNAAGWGWFIDPTPGDDVEFRKVTADGMVATPGSAAYGEMDLVTVVMHELRAHPRRPGRRHWAHVRATDGEHPACATGRQPVVKGV